VVDDDFFSLAVIGAFCTASRLQVVARPSGRDSDRSKDWETGYTIG
jgi:hypothetical protein